MADIVSIQGKDLPPEYRNKAQKQFNMDQELDGDARRQNRPKQKEGRFSKQAAYVSLSKDALDMLNKQRSES